MNLFDKSILEFVIKHFDRSYSLLHTFLFISYTDLLKGGVFAIVIWYLWFKAGPAASEKRVQLLATLISLFFVMAVSLGLAGLMPFRPRPFMNPEFNFASSDPINLYIGKLSSFPS